MIANRDLEATIAQLLVRNLEDQLKTACSAAPSATATAWKRKLAIFSATRCEAKKLRAGGLGTEMANMFRGIGLKEGEEIAEIHDFNMEIPDFES
jgi:hypothetical protein